MRIKIIWILSAWLMSVCPVWAGPVLLDEKGCGDCHRFSPDTKQVTLGPDLFYAGDKFYRGWLKEFLESPVVLRKAGHITDPGFLSGKPETGRPHPSLTQEESARAAVYLMTLRLPGLEAGKVGGEPLSKGTRARMKILFERQYGCIACHETLNLAGQVRGGVSGPSLVDAELRLRPDWIFHWLKTPKKFLSKGRMPLFELDEETVVLMTKYILSIRSRR